MFNKIIVATLFILALSSVGTETALAQDHEHSHEKGDSVQLTLNNGKKWAGDDNLRLSMNRIKGALSAEFPDTHSGKASSRQYLALAKQVHEQVEFIVQNCKLAKDEDAMLHQILTELIAGADAIADKTSSQTQRHGAENIIHSLESYGKYFEHPGWQK